MKLIEIQRHLFTMKGDKERTYFCTEAETDSRLNVLSIKYIKAHKDGSLPEDWTERPTRALTGREIGKVCPIGDALGMAYRPASGIRSLETSVPDSMGEDTHCALAQLTKAVGGDVTDFVCERLGWSREEIEDNLFAEQVDSVALAIYNIEARHQGLIIGDQTGIGKGRMAASLIRYAHNQGRKAIFVTEKSNLFSDIYRDLKDIGCKDLRPFIVNRDSKAVVTELDSEDKIVTVYRPVDSEEYARVIESGRIPEGYDYAMATYSQFNSPKRDGAKIDFLHSAVQDCILILDEAHNAGGTAAAQTRSGEDTTTGSNTFKVFAKAVTTAWGVCYLSATFAKRPDNLPIFALRTCISDSKLADHDLINGIRKGGEALQEVISSELVHEGQMLRRERTYEGIKVNYIYMDKTGAKEFGVPDLERQHRRMSDNITKIMRQIINFESLYVKPIIDGINDDLAAEGESADKTNKEMGVSRSPYFSKVFNVINQVLFAIKAEAVAEHAVRRLREGKKVVIACASTFESLYADLAGDRLDIEKDSEEIISTDYSGALMRGLDGTLVYSEKNAKGEGVKRVLSLSELSIEGQEEYRKIASIIRHTTTGITCSPIDVIEQAEVTGRSTKVVFTSDDMTRGYVTSRKKEKANVAFAKFQNNQSDVLIINTSGSTGASAHATNKGTNLRKDEVKPRVMIIAQCELNVSTEVQKRGRINRTLPHQCDTSREAHDDDAPEEAQEPRCKHGEQSEELDERHRHGRLHQQVWRRGCHGLHEGQSGLHGGDRRPVLYLQRRTQEQGHRREQRRPQDDGTSCDTGCGLSGGVL